MQVRDVMTQDVISVMTKDTVLKAARMMLQNRISGLPVVDAGGRLVGMITEGDFLRRGEIGTERQRPKWLEILLGPGRMAEPGEIATAVEAFFSNGHGTLAGVRALVTAGPTQEPLDPVRFIANRSSGKQGFAIAAAAQAAGADVVLISGPVDLDDPPGVKVVGVESARDMLRQVEAALPADVAIFAAAVADWRVAHEGEQKLKKTKAGMPPLQLVENPDILATISHRTERRPPLVIGFAAETEHLIENATTKLARKGCDWIVANDVSPATGVMGGDRNTVHLLTRDGKDTHVDSWPVMTKEEVAVELIAHVAKAVSKPS